VDARLNEVGAGDDASVNLLAALVVVCGPALAAGLAGRQRWGWLWILALVAGAVRAAATEPANYDMPGFGMGLFIAAALLALLALGAGVVLRRVRKVGRPGLEPGSDEL
jgi:uncharacterized membrane protein YphA (DoxX/SURF4 family)